MSTTLDDNSMGAVLYYLHGEGYDMDPAGVARVIEYMLVADPNILDLSEDELAEAIVETIQDTESEEDWPFVRNY